MANSAEEDMQQRTMAEYAEEVFHNDVQLLANYVRFLWVEKRCHSKCRYVIGRTVDDEKLTNKTTTQGFYSDDSKLCL